MSLAVSILRDEMESWQELLEFERTWRAASRPKDIAVRERFGLSPARYHQQLHRVLDRPEALQFDPVLVRRLRRLREARRTARFAPRLETGTARRTA